MRVKTKKEYLLTIMYDYEPNHVKDVSIEYLVNDVRKNGFPEEACNSSFFLGALMLNEYKECGGLITEGSDIYKYITTSNPSDKSIESYFGYSIDPRYRICNVIANPLSPKMTMAMILNYAKLTEMAFNCPSKIFNNVKINEQAFQLVESGYMPVVFLPENMLSMAGNFMSILDKKKIPYLKRSAYSPIYPSYMMGNDCWVSRMDLADYFGEKPESFRLVDTVRRLFYS